MAILSDGTRFFVSIRISEGPSANQRTLHAFDNHVFNISTKIKRTPMLMSLFSVLGHNLIMVLSWCTGRRGNNHCSFFVQESMFSCCELFGLLYRLLCTGTRGQNPYYAHIYAYAFVGNKNQPLIAQFTIRRFSK